MSDEFDLALLLGVVILLISVAAVRLSTRLGLPSLLVYLALGVMIGESGLGIRFDDAELTRTLGMCALVVIIAEGGLTARWSTLRPALGPAVALSTVGVAVSVAVIGSAAHFVLGLDWRLALLYGAVLSSTDAAAVFSTLRRVRLRPKLSATLEAESGINDAPVVLLVVLLSMPGGITEPWWYELGMVGYELIAGAVVGLMVGFAGAWGLRRAALPAAGLYPLAAVGLTVLAYAVGSVLHASGFLAVYVSGVVLGNARLPHRRAMLGFADGLAWLAQIGLFVLLGLLVSPPRLGSAVLPALLIGAVLLILARPLSVAASVTPFGHARRLPELVRRIPGAGGLTRPRTERRRAERWPAGRQVADRRGRPAPTDFGLREQTFLSWAGLRGAVPVVLATIPLSNQVPGAQQLFDVVFVLVVVFTAVQGTTLPPVAHRLGVTAPGEATDLEVETAPLERMRADLLQLEIPPGSRLSGVHIDELRLPVGAVVTLVLRDGAGFVPGEGTRLRTGDSLLIVATTEVRDTAERRLRAVSRRGRLARWFYELGDDRTGARPGTMPERR